MQAADPERRTQELVTLRETQVERVPVKLASFLGLNHTRIGFPTGH